MPRFAANLSLMFNEVPFLDRFDEAAQAGFHAVEFLFPYEYQAKEIVERVQANRLEVVLFNAPPGDWEAGERGLRRSPGREHEFSAEHRDGAALCAGAAVPAGARDGGIAAGRRRGRRVAAAPADLHPQPARSPARRPRRTASPC